MTVARQATYGAQLGDTPLRGVRAADDAGEVTLELKLESFNPTGSIKDRTAHALLRALDVCEPLVPGTRIVESSSGNLALGLAQLARNAGLGFVAVVDPKASRTVLERLEALGAELETVSVAEPGGGYLQGRLERVRQLCADDPGLRWTNQYENPANPRVHELTTAREIVRQTGGRFDALFAAVSTGGTFAGLRAGLRRAAPRATLVPVDAVGSAATGDHPGRRLLNGIGADRPSSFLSASDLARVIRIGDAEAFAICHVAAADLGLKLGGSSGAVIAAALRWYRGHTGAQRLVCVCADGGERYEETIYCDAWLKAQRTLDPVERWSETARSQGLRFTWCD